MATATLGGFLQRLRKAMAAETLASLSEREVVERFLATHEEASFQALLQRHGPMVLRVCRRVLSEEQDVEDVFQATFLVLAREARTIRKQESLACWLHGVAHRLARNAQKAGVRRRKHEAQAANRAGSAPLTDEVGWGELRRVLDEELVKLPDQQRAPLVHCYLEGLTQDEAAARLGQSKSTFRRNLKRGRERLGVRLTRRGVTLSAALFALLLSECAVSAAVPSALAASTSEAAVAFAAGKAVAALASARALALARGLAHAAVSAKVKVKAVCVLLVAVVVGFGGAAVQRENARLDPTRPAERRQLGKVTTIDPPAAQVDEPKPAKRIEFRNPLLILRAEVQTELKLTKDQVKSLEEGLGKVQEKYREESAKVRAGLPGTLPTPGVPPTLADPRIVAELEKKIDAENNKVLTEVLKPEQANRLKQIELQLQGIWAWQSKQVVEALKLTEDQKDQVKKIDAELDSALRELTADGRNPPTMKIYYAERKIHKEAAAKILSVLTSEQRRRWESMIGVPFQLEPVQAPKNRPADGEVGKKK